MNNEYAIEIERVVKVLLASERVATQDLRNMLTGYSEVTSETIIWRAREELRRYHGIDFGPIRGLSGYLARRSPMQIAKYAGRQRAKGKRAQTRSLERLRLAASKEIDVVQREKIQRAASREEERQNLRRGRAV